MISVTVGRRTLQDSLAAFDEYLGRVRGVCAGTRRNYVGHVRVFLQTVLVGAGGTTAEIGPHDVVEFVGELTRRYEAGTVELAASALRSFFGFFAGRWLVRRAAGERGPDDATSPERSGPAFGSRPVRAADHLA